MSTDPAPARPMTTLEWVLLLTLSLVWGGSFFFAAIAVAEVPPMTVVLVRVGGAALLLWLVIFATSGAIPRDGRVWLAFFGMGALNNAIPFSLIFWAQTDIASGLASILNATTPIFTVLVAHGLTPDERLTPNRLAGVVLGFLGVVILLNGPGAGGAVLPMLAVLAAALSYAFASIFGKRFRALGVAPLTTAAGQVTASALLMAPVVVVFDQPWTLAIPSAAALWSLAGLVTLSTALAYFLYFRILATAGATNLMLVTLLVPPSAILLGVAILGEALSLPQLAGMVVIGLGLVAIDGRLVRRLRSRDQSHRGSA